MDLAHMFHAANLLNHPVNLIRNFHNLQFGAMTVGLPAEFLHHLHELLIVSGDQLATSIQTRLSWSRPLGPVRTKVRFLERLPLAQVSQPQKRPVTEAKTSAALITVARIDDDLPHWLISLSASWLPRWSPLGFSGLIAMTTFSTSQDVGFASSYPSYHPVHRAYHRSAHLATSPLMSP